MDIRITVNKKEMIVTADITINKLLELLQYNSRVSVWVNQKQLLFGDYSGCRIKEGDKVMIYRLVAGG